MPESRDPAEGFHPIFSHAPRLIVYRLAAIPLGPHRQICGFPVISANFSHRDCTGSRHTPVNAVHSAENTRSKTLRLRLT